jgi:hypothetical protein
LRDVGAGLDQQANLQEGERPVEEETAVDVDMTTTTTGSRRNAVGQAIVPEHGSFCVFCELLGEHWSSDCSGNVNEEGYVIYCPLCNNKEHTLLNCKEIEKVKMKWLYNEIRRRHGRAMFPMPWNPFDIMPERWGRGNLPQTPTFAKERLQKLGKQAPGEVVPDPFWENPVLESTWDGEKFRSVYGDPWPMKPHPNRPPLPPRPQVQPESSRAAGAQTGSRGSLMAPLKAPESLSSANSIPLGPRSALLLKREGSTLPVGRPASTGGGGPRFGTPLRSSFSQGAKREGDEAKPRFGKPIRRKYEYANRAENEIEVKKSRGFMNTAGAGDMAAHISQDLLGLQGLNQTRQAVGNFLAGVHYGQSLLGGPPQQLLPAPSTPVQQGNNSSQARARGGHSSWAAYIAGPNLPTARSILEERSRRRASETHHPRSGGFFGPPRSRVRNPSGRFGARAPQGQDPQGPSNENAPRFGTPIRRGDGRGGHRGDRGGWGGGGGFGGGSVGEW